MDWTTGAFVGGLSSYGPVFNVSNRINEEPLILDFDFDSNYEAFENYEPVNVYVVNYQGFFLITHAGAKLRK